MRNLFFNGILCVAFIAMGCAGPEKPEGMPDLLPVTLVLTQDGTPLAGANVALAPVEQTAGRNWTSGGMTDESGTVVISTYGKFRGAPAGTYKVALRKTKETGPISRDDGPEGIAEYKQWEAEHAKELAQIKTVSCIEKAYTSAATTPLEITVDQGNTRFELNAGKSVEEEIKRTRHGM